MLGDFNARTGQQKMCLFCQRFLLSKMSILTFLAFFHNTFIIFWTCFCFDLSSGMLYQSFVLWKKICQTEKKKRLTYFFSSVCPFKAHLRPVSKAIVWEKFICTHLLELIDIGNVGEKRKWELDLTLESFRSSSALYARRPQSCKIVKRKFFILCYLLNDKKFCSI